MFDCILIANRGEIACRVIRTARALGVRTVAVYSDADARAAHVEMADQAVHIGGPRPADSYLRGDRIIAAALATGAKAIHPGYGFLSENPEFVEAVEAAGLVFIGPSAAAIRAMGLKDAAKALMHEAGVPVVPGYMGANQDPEHLAGAADGIGYPVLIKAVAGGRRQGHAAGRAACRLPRRAGKRAGRGGDRVRQCRGAGREIHSGAAAHRGAGVRRWRAGGASVRARLLVAAAPPEGDRGGPGARHDRGDARRHGAGGGAGGRGDRLQGRGHGGIHRRRLEGAQARRVLVHGDEHPPAGRASGDRGDHRRRSGGMAVARGLGRKPAGAAGGSDDQRPRLRGAALRRGRAGGVPAGHRHAVASGFP